MPAQRWRLILARSADAPDLGQRDQLAAWDGALDAAGLRGPVGGEIARVVPAATVPAGLTADRDLADLYLPRRIASVELRERLTAHMPAGHRLIELHDVWVGEPSLPGQVIAGDYLVDVAVASSGAGEGMHEAAPPDLRAVVEAFLAAETIERMRTRPDKAAPGNLRPLVLDLAIQPDGRVWMRLRVDPAAGTGRPEEVVAALGSLAGRPFIVIRKHRLRIWLRDDRLTPAPSSVASALS